MPTKEQVQEALDQIRPALQADGGDVELVEVCDDGVVKVALQGACRGCPMSQLTLANGVERVAMIKYGVHDIRWLYENDLRYLEQFV